MGLLINRTGSRNGVQELPACREEGAPRDVSSLKGGKKLNCSCLNKGGEGVHVSSQVLPKKTEKGDHSALRGKRRGGASDPASSQKKRRITYNLKL